MKATVSSPYVLRFAKGEEIVATLLEFCREKNITAATVSAIGAVLEAEIGFYDLPGKEYVKKKCGGMEIVSLQGNIALVDGAQFLHAHVVLSDKDMRTVGGHLFHAVTGATCELILQPLEHHMTRSLDEHTGLKLLDL